jgi:molybdopterin-guanine dinucleotide biosynthesis protein A
LIWEVGMMKASGVVLSGGHSSRMGQDKALMLFNGETIIARTARELQKAVDDVIIVINDKLKYNIPGVTEIPDVYPDMGPLSGIHAGLLQARHQVALIISCDMPLFSVRLAEYLLERSPGYDVVVPRIGDQWEPMCAVYSKNCIGPIEKCLRSGAGKISRFYPEVRVRAIEQREIEALGKPEDLFYNMNTPEEYRSFLLRMAGRSSDSVGDDKH